MALIDEVARTLLSLAESGDLLAPVDSAEAQDLAERMLTRWDSQTERLKAPTDTARRDDLVKGLRTLFGFDPVSDLPDGSYRYVVIAVIDTINRGFHIDPIPPESLGLVQPNPVAESLRRRFEQSLHTVLPTESPTVKTEEVARNASFRCYRVAADGDPYWLLANIGLPIFAATASQPELPSASGFVDPDLNFDFIDAGWSYRTAVELNSDLNRHLLSRLPIESRTKIETWKSPTVGSVMFNLWP